MKTIVQNKQSRISLERRSIMRPLFLINTLVSLLCILHLAFGCNVTCPVNSGRTKCRAGLDNYCPGSYSGPKATCDTETGYCRCFKSALYDECTCLPSYAGCLIKSSPSTYVGLPSSDGTPETPFYGCVSTATNCEYEVHVIANYESSNGRNYGYNFKPVPGNTYVNVNINGQSSKPLVLVFISYEEVNWQLSLSSGVVVNRILLGGHRTSKLYGYSNNSVEVVPRNMLSSGYGSDDGGGSTAENLIYLTKRFGPISSFSGSYRADRWTVNINRSPVCNSSISTHSNQSIVVRFERERYYIHEYENATVVLLTNGPTNRDIAVHYSTIDGTARAPMDYTAINQERIIPAGTARFEINIPIKNDRVPETDETFKVHLSLPDEPTLCIPDAIVSIIRQPTRPTTNRPTTNRPTTNRPFDNRPSVSSAGTLAGGLLGGIFGGIALLSLAIFFVSFVSIRYYTTRSRVRVVNTRTAYNWTTSDNFARNNPTIKYAFNLKRSDQESVAATITQPQTCLSITQAPPPAYDIHETFATCNENSKSEAPPYLQPPPPTYDTATQQTKYEPHNIPKE